MSWHLFRVSYRTDATDEDPDYQGSFSDTIPDSALRDGAQIVGVDWSQRGWVEVTYLKRGEFNIRAALNSEESQ
ncbi:hypothetical protein [Amycolatopsis pigmentata]|uniref:SH3 domain-containing protein n=1 Tax=Amycolatopsis pigmentata TaxID=450801 RepID=A0ABW5G411_9PSEU